MIIKLEYIHTMLYVHHNHSTTDIDHYPFFSSAGAMQRGISDDRVISVSMFDRNPVIGLEHHTHLDPKVHQSKTIHILHYFWFIF